MSEAPPFGLDPARINDIDLLSPTLRLRWRELAEQWATADPFYVFLMGFPMLVTGRHDDVRDVLLDRDRFSAASPISPPPGDIFMGLPQLNSMDGEGHDRLRKLLMPFFGREGTERLGGAIDGIVADLLDEVDARGGTFDAMADIAEPLVERTLLQALFGVEGEQQRQFVAYANVMPLAMAATPEGGYPDAFVAEFDATTSMIEGLFEDRRRDPRDDFISGLVQAKDGGFEVSHEEMVGNTLAVYAGAQLATATSVGVLLMNLAAHPEQYARLREDPELVSGAVEESLRHHPAGLFGFPRYALTDTEVGGVPVFAGMPIQVGLASANQDPGRYPDPGRFDIQRAPTGVLSFSTGAHQCVGARVARMILTGAARGVAARYPQLRLADPNFTPTYGGVLGELKPDTIPLVTSG